MHPQRDKSCGRRTSQTCRQPLNDPGLHTAASPHATVVDDQPPLSAAPNEPAGKQTNDSANYPRTEIDEGKYHQVVSAAGVDAQQAAKQDQKAGDLLLGHLTPPPTNGSQFWKDPWTLGLELAAVETGRQFRARIAATRTHRVSRRRCQGRRAHREIPPGTDGATGEINVSALLPYSQFRDAEGQAAKQADQPAPADQCNDAPEIDGPVELASPKAGPLGVTLAEDPGTSGEDCPLIESALHRFLESRGPHGAFIPPEEFILAIVEIMEKLKEERNKMVQEEDKNASGASDANDSTLDT